MLQKLLSYFKRPSIAYCITVCNEAKEIKALLDTLLPLIGRNDEVIVLQDVTQKNAEVTTLLQHYGNTIKLIEARLNNDFATFKNHFFGVATKDYIFQIDADELPKPTLIKNLKRYIGRKYKYDVFLVPRINIVHGLTQQHIRQWNWQVNNKGYVNFPDYQTRICRNNGKIKWVLPVHETLQGFERQLALPIKDESFCLLHVKEIARQEQQNSYYDSLA
jgi:glycosyltransferase involved in cell wall biosynthesis